MVPEAVTATHLPLGGHSTLGLTDKLTRGSVAPHDFGINKVTRRALKGTTPGYLMCLGDIDGCEAIATDRGHSWIKGSYRHGCGHRRIERVATPRAAHAFLPSMQVVPVT